MSDSSQKLQTVVLLHGMCRSRYSMYWYLGRRLKKEGYQVLLFPYFSFLGTIEDHSDQLRIFIQKNAAHPTVHLIGHSLGGIVARVFLNRHPNVAISSVIMLTPPNRAPTISKMLKNIFLYRLFTGKAGQQIARDDFFNRYPIPDNANVGIIAGALSNPKLFTKIFNEPHDFILKVSETKAQRNHDWIAVPSGHTFIMYRKDTFQLVKRYLQSFSFE